MNQASIAHYIEDYQDSRFSQFKRWFDTEAIGNDKVSIRYHMRQCCVISRDQYASIVQAYSDLPGRRTANRRAFAMYHWMLDNKINPLPTTA